MTTPWCRNRSDLQQRNFFFICNLCFSGSLPSWKLNIYRSVLCIRLADFTPCYLSWLDIRWWLICYRFWMLLLMTWAPWPWHGCQSVGVSVEGVHHRSFSCFLMFSVTLFHLSENLVHFAVKQHLNLDNAAQLCKWVTSGHLFHTYPLYSLRQGHLSSLFNGSDLVVSPCCGDSAL